jgi:hypothetical protein
MKTLHTLSPWQVSPLGNVMKNSLKLASIEQMPSNNENERMANARLIAAAPDLLDALEACLDYLLLDSMMEEDAAPEIEKGRSALRKAKGE